ncbi:bifunctional tetrahydrofolate synthase/dihydrofolate synthase [Colwellia psychrerythraea]|uniref:Dihydrofolate synthase/folylpolyglutamate synthase n=1 Tax=Colwellia psychrerythraea TaxID=28229 RepID=A0A099L0G3_COLPS|nr:bifunctional tetrahydrofolate synthase/dihydrofolate synthase [Colwellia psychrerythraea]KGJ96366.1 FolC bifunctional protein [Colwellia psychrerythraea]
MSKSNSSHYQDFTNLDQWLYYLENLHSSEIELGLARIGKVAQRLAIDLSFAKVITVAGTNGKGTTCAFIENSLLNSQTHGLEQGVAVYSSPHIERFNERLRINKQDIDDQPLIDAFKAIEHARAEISLSYYEYTTLAALLVLMHVKPAFIILEVGLGGRLDATNLIDADIAVVTTVDLDHQDFLGNDKETIGFEKAGIMRKGQDIVIGDANIPKSVLTHAGTLHAHHGGRLFLRESEFVIKNESTQRQWQWQTTKTRLKGLKAPFIPQDNVATALMVLEKLELTLTSDFVNRVISITKVAGRTELIEHVNQCDVILDVGHNPQATRYLANHIKQLKAQHNYQKVFAVVAMLGDKDISASLLSLKDDIDFWYAGALSVPRAATKEAMQSKLAEFTEAINCFDNVDEAFKMASEQASSSDLILVFGSFFTVAKIRSQLITC